MRRVRFAVSERFVGARENTIEVSTGLGDGDCGIAFQHGHDYLVYAYRNSVTRDLYTGICTRTSTLESATADLAYLRSLRGNAPPPARLYGFVTTNPRDAWLGQKTAEPLAGVPVHLKSTSLEWKTQTDAAGAFDFPDLPSGALSMSADLPGLLGGGEARTISLHDHGCSEQIVVATEQASISGKVFDVLNNPISTTVHLIPATQASHGRVASGYAGRDGAFTISHVAPGDYLLGVNVFWPPTDGEGLKMPWPPTYYPGVQNRVEAQPVHVGSAQRLSGFDFRLPRPLSRRTITGVVTWPDGKPAMAFVELKDNEFESNVNLGNSGRDGTFTITGVVDRPYSISAVTGLGQNEKPVHSARIVLGPSENGPVHLVLNMPGKD